jgi:peptide/nickel transport system permease protein
MLEVLREDYIITAVAKGTPKRLVVLKHALKNAFAPILTVIGFQIGFLLGGTVVIEDVYSIPGVGKLIFQAIASRITRRSGLLADDDIHVRGHQHRS